MRKEGRLRLADNESLFVKCVQRLGSHAFGGDIHHPIRDGSRRFSHWLSSTHFENEPTEQTVH